MLGGQPQHKAQPRFKIDVGVRAQNRRSVPRLEARHVRITVKKPAAHVAPYQASDPEDTSLIGTGDDGGRPVRTGFYLRAIGKKGVSSRQLGQFSNAPLLCTDRKVGSLRQATSEMLGKLMHRHCIGRLGQEIMRISDPAPAMREIASIALPQ